MSPDELVGIILDWAVAMCEGNPVRKQPSGFLFLMDRDRQIAEWRPSSAWAQGGPIIERERLSLRASGAGDWVAMSHDVEHPDRVVCYGDTPLIAAMRCYVTMKMGYDIEVPEHLLP